MTRRSWWAAGVWIARPQVYLASMVDPVAERRERSQAAKVPKERAEDREGGCARGFGAEKGGVDADDEENEGVS
ncbi:hypothetical protein MTO96_012146 [Rhipicephalus appendiculatus]